MKKSKSIFLLSGGVFFAVAALMALNFYRNRNRSISKFKESESVDESSEESFPASDPPSWSTPASKADYH